MNASTAHEIGLDQAAAGMTLAAALLDAHGGVLLPRDTALTDATLASLRRRGVERCVVWSEADADNPADAAARALEQERQLQRLARLFRHGGGDDDAGPELMAVLAGYRRRERP
jgi:hypothetical protein